MTVTAPTLAQIMPWHVVSWRNGAWTAFRDPDEARELGARLGRVVRGAASLPDIP